MTTQQTTWTKFDGSDEQIAEILKSEEGYILTLNNGFTPWEE